MSFLCCLSFFFFFFSNLFFFPAYSALELGCYRGLRFADKLAAASELKDPIDRLAEVMAWCMTSSENEPFNKKPYNPVLGEELTCWIDHGADSKTVFRAEQVSHHPPVSAFVMFNKKLDLLFECNVEFAVQFHGNSVTISTRGYGNLRFGRLDESYSISKYIPDLKIESCVFGNRRQVWRGEWEIRCEKTGLAAVLNFTENKTASGWFGGGSFVNEVAGFVWNVQDEKKTPLATVSGIAGEKLVLQKPKGPEKVILEFQALKPLSLSFLPPNMTPPNDSLRVWQKVTQFILQDNMKKADRAKHRVEENARKLRKQREESGEEHKAKYFTFDEAEQRWVHNDAALSETTEGDVSYATTLTADDASTCPTKTDLSESDSE